MNYATAWFLVAMAGDQYIGPLPQAECQAAAQIIQSGVSCRQAASTMSCQAPNQPGAYMVCPVFQFPKVQIK